MESRDTRKSFAHTSQRLRESKNTDNSLLSGPVEPIKMLFISTSSGWERISTENNGRIDYSSKSVRPSYGVDSPNAMLKYACRNRAQERLQQGCNDKHAFPGGDLTRRDVPVSTAGCRSSRGEAPPPLVGSPDMPMPGIPVAEVRESVMVSRLPSGPSIVEKKPSVTNLHGSRDNWARISEEASCSRKHGGSSFRHRDFLTGPKVDSSTNSVERTASSDLHSASSVFQTVSKALESQKRNKQNYDSSISKKHLNSDHMFSSSAANPEYSSAPFSNRPDIQSERTNTILNNMNNSVFNSLSSIDEMMKAPDGCEYRNFSLHSNSSTVRVAQSAQHDLNQSVIKFEELIDVVSSTMTELHNISTSDSFDSCTDNVPKINDYRRYRQVQEVTSNVNCYVTTEPGLNPVSVSAFTTTTVTNVGDSRRSHHSVGDSFLNDYQKISSDFSPHIDGCYKFNADESGDRNTRTKNIKYSSHKNHCDKDFHCQEGAKPKNTCEKEEEELSKTLNKNQEVNTNEREKMKSSDSFSKEVFQKKGSKPYHINTSEKVSVKDQSGDVNETQESGRSPDKVNVNYATEGLDTNASMKPETSTQRQESNKLAEKRDSVANSAGAEKSLNKRLETRITKLSDKKFYNSTTPVEIAHSIISDFSRSIGSSVNNRPPCQTLIGCNFEKNELKIKEEPGLVNNNDLSQSIKAKATKSSDTSDFSDSLPNSPRKTDLESRGCEFVILDEKPQEVLNSDLNCVIQERATTEKDPEKNSELNYKNTTEQAQTKTEDITEQSVSDEIKSERSRNQNTNVEVKKSEYEKCKEFTGSNILQSLDRKVLDVMELVNNQLQKERTRQSSQPDSTNIRKKTQKNTGVRNDSGRFAKAERVLSKHGLPNKHLDSRSNKCFQRGNSSRRADDLEYILRSRRKDRQIEIPEDTSGSCNGDEEISTSLKPVATLSVISEDSDVSKQPEPDQRTMLDTLVDNVTGMIKLKKFQMCLIDTLKNSAAESETQPCSKRVTRPISPANVRLQRKSMLPKSLPELDKEKVSSAGVFPTSARCSLMCQDTRVECIAPDLKKREEEIKKPLKPKETTKELHLKANKIGISNTLITAPKRDNNREIKSVIKNQARDKKRVNKYANKKNLESKTLKSTEIPIIDDKAESGSEKISPVGSSANVYDIKVNIINKSTSITNLVVEKISGSINAIQKEACSQVRNSTDENYESVVNSCESLNETSQDQITNQEKRGKAVKQHYAECKSKIPPNKNGLIETEKNELHDSHPHKENLIQSDSVLIPHQSKDNLSSLENVKPLVSNNDAKLIKSHSGNNNICAGDKLQCKNNKSVSDSLVKDRKAHLKRNIRITKCMLPTNSPLGDGELYHNTTKVADNSLKMKEQKRTGMKSSEKIKDRSDKHTKSNSRWTKPCNLEQTDAKTKSTFSSGTTSFGVHKLSKLTAIKPTTSSDRNESKGVPESNDFKGTTEPPKLFEGYACGSYVKVDAQTCAGEQKVTLDTGGISKVQIKTNNSKQISSMGESSHKPSCYEETNRKTKVLTGYSAALFIKPDGQVTEMNLGRNICSKRNCNSKQTSGQTSGGCIQVEISQDTSSSSRVDKYPKNANANNIHTHESIKDIISSKYSAVKLFFEKPPRSVEEKIISQVYYENGFISGNKSQPFDLVLNGFKFSDNRKIVKNKSSMMNKMNPLYDTDGLCLLSPEENNIFIDRNKIVPPVYKRGSSAQNRSAPFFKEIPVIEKKLSTLIEILESLINDDKHEDISYKSSTDNREETETLGTKEDVVSIEEETVNCKKHIIEEETNEPTLECLNNSKGSTKLSEISRVYANSEINSIIPETGSKKNQFESDVSQTISTKGKSLLSEKILAADRGNECCELATGEITKNISSHLERTKDLSIEERLIDITFSQSNRSNNDALESENNISTMNENREMVNKDVNMPSCKSRSYELETLNAYGDETSMECTGSSKHNEVLNQSRRSSCSSLFSSCDSLTTNDYVEIFRGYIDGDNSTEKEVDLYDDSTESSNITENNTLIKQQLEEWKMNILQNKDNSQSSEVSYNLTVGRVSSSDSTAHYPSESEVSTYPRRISTQSSNISSLKKLYWTERNENKRKNNLVPPDIKPEGNKWYSVAELSQSKYMNTGNDTGNYWTFDDYLRVDKNSPPGCSNRIGINVETISEVTSSNLDREIFPSLSSIISKCVEETLNNTLRDITASIDFETYGHALSQKLQSYNDSEHSSCQELITNESHACETTDSDSNLCNRGGNTMRTTRINANPFSEDSNEYPSSFTNSHREIIFSGYKEILNDSSTNSEEDDSKGNCTSSAFQSSQYGVRHSIDLYRGVRTSSTTWQRGPQKSVEEEENSQASSQEQTSVSSENSEVDESSASHESLETVHGESPVAVLDLTSPETVTRVLDAMAHSEERQPIDDELEGEMGLFEYHDMPEFVMDESVIHASSDFVLPYPTEDSENTRSDASCSLSRLAEQYSAAVLTTRRTSSAWLEGTLRRLSLESCTTGICGGRRTREDRGGGALAISICICLFVFVCNRSFLYGDDDY